MNVHDCIIFHVFQKTALFYGVFDEERQVSEEQLARTFQEGANLIIGQSKTLQLGEDHFYIANLEDIITCIHVSKADRALAQSLLKFTKHVGKQFKKEMQVEIDEFDACSSDPSVFNNFAPTLTAHITAFIENISKGLASGPIRVDRAAVTDARPVLQDQEDDIKVVDRFPGGIIKQEERDEVLFQEYNDISKIYNVEMLDGIITKNKVHVVSNLGQYHAITVDFTAFPARPTINLPREVSEDMLALSRLYQEWTPENPPRIVELVSDLEQILGNTGSMPQVAPLVFTPPEEGTGVDQPTHEKPRRKKKEETGEEKARASLALVESLMAQRGEIQAPNILIGCEDETGASTEYLTPVMGDIEDILQEEIDGEDLQARSIPLKEIIHEQDAQTPIIEQYSTAHEEGKRLETKERPSFVIKPRIVIGDEEMPGPQAAPVKTRPPSEETPARAEPAPLAINSMPSENGAFQIKKTAFTIPDVDELDTFSPVISTQRQRVDDKATVITPVSRSTRPGGTAVGGDVMPGWGDDGGEIAVSKAKEIEEPDFQIKKVGAAPRESRDASSGGDVMPGWGDDGGEITVSKAKEIEEPDFQIKKVSSPDDLG